jgi:hypothetical protein
MNRSQVVGNTNTNGDGTAAFGVNGLVTLTDSIVANNLQPNGGAVIGTGGGVTMTRSSVIDNEGLAIGTRAPIVLVDSTVARNTEGGMSGSTASLTNSTVADNGGAGIGARSGISLVYSTVTRNSDGVSEPNLTTGGDLVSFASIVAQPDGGTNCGISGATVSHGYNFSDDESCGFTSTTDIEVPSIEPMLGPLGDNGGPTLTRLPLAGSPLIDAIPTSSCQENGGAGVTADQRLLPRPSLGGCDIGAVEVQAEPEPAPVVAVTPKFPG